MGPFCSLSLCFWFIGSDHDSKQSLSQSEEDEEPSSLSRVFRRETRATRRAAQNKGAKRKHGETPQCVSLGLVHET